MERVYKGRLTTHDLARFSGETLFDRIGRAVCEAGCLPRKELHEAWEVARRVRRLCRGGRVMDLAGGHGLLAHIMLLLDDTSPYAVVVDTAIPPSAAKLQAALVAAWPRLDRRVKFRQSPIDDVALEPTDVVVSSHACGALTDEIIDRATFVRARVAVLPCCHDLRASDTGALTGWIDGPLAVDIMRVHRMREHGYQVWTQTIPADITPKNRLLIGAPKADDHMTAVK
ncbi:MAG: methyltransferase domain-containing protein [Acidobacteria bacterium]|nr:methyltransferase domain-containing protein [Acidobacteriota bacterium]